MRFEPVYAKKSAGPAPAISDDLGAMPEWDLSDLYKGPKDIAVENDIADASNDAARMKARYQGQLSELAKDGAKLAGAVKEYEALADAMGKLGSYAGLYYAQNSGVHETAGDGKDGPQARPGN